MSKPAGWTAGALCILAVWLGGIRTANGQAAKAEKTERPAGWAQPVTKPGLPNLHKVSEVLYRGAQPSAEVMKQLQQMGIKTVVNLRSLHSDRDELGGTRLGYEHIVFNILHPEEQDVVRFLKILADPKHHPVFVHCAHGADRTGTMVAFYRIVFQGWSKSEALREMTEGGFGFHSIWRHLVTFVRATNIDRLREACGCSPVSHGIP